MSPHLGPLVETLERVGVETRVYVNSVHDQVIEDWILPQPTIHMPGASIYTEWNHAAAWALDEDAYLLQLNDDIVITQCLPGALAMTMNRESTFGLLGVGEYHLVCDPGEAVETSFALGNRYAFSAWCFMVRPGTWTDVDERFRIWYGDDELIWNVNAAGWRTGVVRGVGVIHHTSTTSTRCPWTVTAAGEDRVLWESKGH
jgi:GT2 family glycosyltransferase